jgi:NAD(P)-dependent dehydrogenase (short-subunit alcohol dehydrogenase family)
MAKVALVTGASGALGSAIAEKLAALGYAVGLHYHSRPDEVAKLRTHLESLGVPALAVRADVRDRTEVGAMVGFIEETLGPVDLAVNNAGLVRDRTCLKITPEDWEIVLDTNLRGAFHVCQAVFEGMRKRGSGRIVNISSIVGAMGNYGQVSYSAAKAGLIGLTKSLARETARYKVTVNAICPGFMDTPMVRAVPEDVQKKLIEQIPLGSFGPPSAVAEAVAYLAGPGGDWITGQILHVNGGMYM